MLLCDYVVVLLCHCVVVVLYECMLYCCVVVLLCGCTSIHLRCRPVGRLRVCGCVVMLLCVVLSCTHVMVWLRDCVVA